MSIWFGGAEFEGGGDGGEEVGGFEEEGFGALGDEEGWCGGM